MKYLKILLLVSIFIFSKAFSNSSAIELKLAIESNDSQVVRIAFKNYMVSGNPDFGYKSPLHYALWKGHFYSAMALIDSGIDLSIVDKNGNNALVHMCDSREDDIKLAIVKKFIEAGISFDSSNPKNLSYLAYCGRNPGIIRLIAKEKVIFDINKVPSGNIWSTLAYLVRTGASPEIIELLSYTNPDFTFRDQYGKTLIHQAVTGYPVEGDPEIVKYLVAKGVNVNARDDSSETALMAAVFDESLPHIKALVESGAIIRLQNLSEGEKNRTVLDYLSNKLDPRNNRLFRHGKDHTREIYRYLVEQNDIQTL